MKNYLVQILIKYRESYAGLPKTSYKRIFISFINNTCGGIIFFLSLYLIKTLKFNVAEAGIIISAYGLGNIIGSSIGGKLSDSISPGQVSFFSLLIEALTFFLMLKVKVFYLIIINLFFYGMATYCFKVSNNFCLINKPDKTASLKIINILYVVSNFGIGVSALIVSLFGQYGFEYLFFLFGFLLLLSAFTLISELNMIEKKGNIANKYLKNEIKNRTPKKIINNILVCVFFIGLIVAQRSTTYNIYIHDKFSYLGINGIGILFALNPLLIIFFQVPLVNFFNSYNKIAVVGLGAFFMGIGMYILNLSYYFFAAIIACIIYTIGEMLFFSTAQFICYEKTDENKRGTSLGNFQMVYAASIFIGPTIGGWAYSHWNANIIWDFSGIIGLLCLLSCIFFSINTNTSPSKRGIDTEF